MANTPIKNLDFNTFINQPIESTLNLRDLFSETIFQESQCWAEKITEIPFFVSRECALAMNMLTRVKNFNCENILRFCFSQNYFDPVSPFMKKVLEGVESLPLSTRKTAYIGLRHNLIDAFVKIDPKWLGFLHCFSNIDYVRKSFEKSGKKSGISEEFTIFVINFEHGYDFAPFSESGEDIIFVPPSELEVTRIIRDKSESIIEFRQKISVHEIMDPEKEKFSEIITKWDYILDARYLNELKMEINLHKSEFPNSVLYDLYHARILRVENSYNITPENREIFNSIITKTSEIILGEKFSRYLKYWAYFLRGETNRLIESWEQCISDCSNAIAKFPEFPFPYCTRAAGYRFTGKYNAAIEDCTKSIEYSKKKNHTAYWHRAESYQGIAGWYSSIDDAKMAISLNPTYQLPYDTLAYAYKVIGNFQECIESCSKSIEICADDWALTSRGEAFYMMGDFHRAIRDFSCAVSINPLYERAIKGRAVCFYELGNFKKVVEDFTILIGIAPGESENYGERGRAFVKLGKDAEASRDFNEAFTLGDFTYLNDLTDLTQ